MQNSRQTTSSYQRSRSHQSSFVSSRLTQSVDNPLNYDFIYNSWDTLSAGIADKIRSTSVRVEKSNQFPAIEERDERYPLLTSVREEPVSEEPVKRTGISWISVSFGLANAAIGVGLLNYPSIYSRIGGVELATGIQLAMLACLMVSMVIIIYCADIHGSCSYHEVLSSMCGPRAKAVVAFDIALATYGICIAYLVTMGDQYDRIFASLVGSDFCKHWYLNRRFMMSMTAIAIFPICLLKRLDFLKHTGPLGIFAMLYVVFLSVYEYFQMEPLAGNHIEEKREVSEIIACIPVILFGYQCNEVIVPIYASLKDRNLTNFLKAAVTAYSILVLLYCTVGTFGYLSYGSSVAPNVMLMFNASDPLVLLGIIALIFKMAVTYPQMAFAGREALSGIIHQEPTELEGEEVAAGDGSWRFWSSVVWFISSLLIAAYVPNIGIVLQTLGILAAVNVFVCPALCLFFLASRKDMNYGTRTKAMQIILATTLLIVGAFFIVFVVGQIYADVERSLKEGTKSLCTA